MKTNKIVIFGDSAFAEIAYEYFTHDSIFEVVAFSVSKSFNTKPSLFNLPIIDFEDIEMVYPPAQYQMFIALVYNSLNRTRTSFYNQAKTKGYTLVNYISSKSFVWHNVQLGDNCFIFENNTIQPFVKIGNNNIFWSGNHIGHHTSIADNNFFSSQVVVSGFCEIKHNNFFGVNATIANNIFIESDCIIGSAVHIVKNVPSGSLIKGLANKAEDITTWQKLNIDKL